MNSQGANSSSSTLSFFVQCISTYKCLCLEYLIKCHNIKILTYFYGFNISNNLKAESMWRSHISIQFSISPQAQASHNLDLNFAYTLFMETAKYIFSEYPSGNIINSILCFRIITSPEYPQKNGQLFPSNTLGVYDFSKQTRTTVVLLSLQ